MTRGEIDHDVAAAEAADEDEVIYEALQVASNTAASSQDLLHALVLVSALTARRLGRLTELLDERLPGDL